MCRHPALTIVRAARSHRVVMSETSPPRGTFVPVSETLRERGARSWLGDRWPRADLAWLVGITAVAALLRLYRLEQWSLSVDEAETWRAATESLADSPGLLARTTDLHPLCYVSLRLLLDNGVLPFHGEGWLRVPFTFVGILTVPLLGWLSSTLSRRIKTIQKTIVSPAATTKSTSAR